MDIELSKSTVDLLIWLSENPGRRILTQWGADPQRVRVNGKVVTGSMLLEQRELAAEGLLRTEGDGKWKLSPKGILLAGIRSGRLPNGPRPGKREGQVHHRRSGDSYGGKQKCQATKRDGKPCQSWAQRGSPYCSNHPDGTPKPKVPAFVIRDDKLSPAAKQARRKPGTLPNVEIPDARPWRPEAPQELHELPPLPSPDVGGEDGPCRPHGIESCPQCEEAEQLDKLAGDRLRNLAARRKASR